MSHRIAFAVRSFLPLLVLAGIGTLSTAAWSQVTGRLGVEPLSSDSRFRARVGLQTSLTADSPQTAWTQQSGVVLGDYYFSRVRLGSSNVSGGFRATSGLLLNQRPSRPALSSVESSTEPWLAAPYLGLGWTGVSARGGWGLTADIGLAGRTSGSPGLRVTGAQGLDDLLRELRLTPMLHLGVSYAF
jgi:hypothetical protein